LIIIISVLIEYIKCFLLKKKNAYRFLKIQYTRNDILVGRSSEIRSCTILNVVVEIYVPIWFPIFFTFFRIKIFYIFHKYRVVYKRRVSLFQSVGQKLHIKSRTRTRENSAWSDSLPPPRTLLNKKCISQSMEFCGVFFYTYTTEHIYRKILLTFANSNETKKTHFSNVYNFNFFFFFNSCQ